MAKYYHPDTDQFRKWDVPLPTAVPHLTDEEIAQNMKQLKPNEWKLEGNELVGMTELGELRQVIDPSYICVGTDNQGLPILRKVDI